MGNCGIQLRDRIWTRLSAKMAYGGAGVEFGCTRTLARRQVIVVLEQVAQSGQFFYIKQSKNSPKAIPKQNKTKPNAFQHSLIVSHLFLGFLPVVVFL
jgi:hypothetical protein